MARTPAGMHSGCVAADLRENRAAGGRMHYGGQLLRVASAVESAAAGGVVLLSEDAFKQVMSM